MKAAPIVLQIRPLVRGLTAGEIAAHLLDAAVWHFEGRDPKYSLRDLLEDWAGRENGAEQPEVIAKRIVEVVLQLAIANVPHQP